MNKDVLHKISYGLYLLSAQENGKDNACIINTAVQVANGPKISVSVAKGGLTHDMIKATGKFNVSMISADAPFALFEHFGLQSGRAADKFKDAENVARSENGLYYLTAYANAFMSVKVTDVIDLGSHTLFVGEMTDGEVLSDSEPCTYAYYHANIKKLPKSNPAVKGWQCRICGFVYEGETLPEDFLCPLCSHGVEDFEPIS